MTEYKGEEISSDIPEHSSKTQTSVETCKKKKKKKEAEHGLGYC